MDEGAGALVTDNNFLYLSDGNEYKQIGSLSISQGGNIYENVSTLTVDETIRVVVSALAASGRTATLAVAYLPIYRLLSNLLSASDTESLTAINDFSITLEPNSAYEITGSIAMVATQTPNIVWEIDGDVDTFVSVSATLAAVDNPFIQTTILTNGQPESIGTSPDYANLVLDLHGVVLTGATPPTLQSYFAPGLIHGLTLRNGSFLRFTRLGNYENTSQSVEVAYFFRFEITIDGVVVLNTTYEAFPSRAQFLIDGVFPNAQSVSNSSGYGEMWGEQSGQDFSIQLRYGFLPDVPDGTPIGLNGFLEIWSSQDNTIIQRGIPYIEYAPPGEFLLFAGNPSSRSPTYTLQPNGRYKAELSNFPTVPNTAQAGQFIRFCEDICISLGSIPDSADIVLDGLSAYTNGLACQNFLLPNQPCPFP
ncbi:MAG: hypothetical protein ACRC78_02990, partial [Planktothrix sp.]